MRFKPDTKALTALLGLLTAMSPLATDIYLPSLPVMVAEFHVGPEAGQLTLSAFLFGFAVAQLIYGPLGDRFGRRPVLMAGLCLFVVASLACAFSPSIEWLTVGRFVQALGGAGPVVLARAVVRDLYSGPRAGRELALMGMVMGVVPAIAPILGAGLEIAFGWRSSFIAMFVFGAIGLVLVWNALPETLHTRAHRFDGPLDMARGYVVLLRHRGFVAHVLLLSIAYGGLFAWISASSFVLQGIYGLSETGFAAAFTVGVAGFVAGSFLSSRLVVRLGLGRTLGVGCLFLLAGGLSMLACVLIGFGHPAEVVGPMMIYLAGIGLVMPQGMAAALQPFPDRAGAASSLVGFVQMSFAAVFGLGVGQNLESSSLPLACAIAGLGVTAALIHALTKRVRALA
jgi:DHA1 family bicyclomycin/chloramphenicol resistance-like MFS transporter